ncbi:hypothetical protein Droror1_Dr00010076 [Drosera rotundifolia]
MSMRKIRTVNINSRYRFELWCGTKGEFHFILFLKPGSNHYFLPAQVHNGCQVKSSHLYLATSFPMVFATAAKKATVAAGTPEKKGKPIELHTTTPEQTQTITRTLFEIVKEHGPLSIKSKTKTETHVLWFGADFSWFRPYYGFHSQTDGSI